MALKGKQFEQPNNLKTSQVLSSSAKHVSEHVFFLLRKYTGLGISESKVNPDHHSLSLMLLVDEQHKKISSPENCRPHLIARFANSNFALSGES